VDRVGPELELVLGVVLERVVAPSLPRLRSLHLGEDLAELEPRRFETAREAENGRALGVAFMLLFERREGAVDVRLVHCRGGLRGRSGRRKTTSRDKLWTSPRARCAAIVDNPARAAPLRG